MKQIATYSQAVVALASMSSLYVVSPFVFKVAICVFWALASLGITFALQRKVDKLDQERAKLRKRLAKIERDRETGADDLARLPEAARELLLDIAEGPKRRKSTALLQVLYDFKFAKRTPNGAALTRRGWLALSELGLLYDSVGDSTSDVPSSSIGREGETS